MDSIDKTRPDLRRPDDRINARDRGLRRVSALSKGLIVMAIAAVVAIAGMISQAAKPSFSTALAKAPGGATSPPNGKVPPRAGLPAPSAGLDGPASVALAPPPAPPVPTAAPPVVVSSGS